MSLQEMMVLVPKMRRARDVGQDCSCPPGMCLFSLYKQYSQVIAAVHTWLTAHETSAVMLLFLRGHDYNL